MRKTTYILAGVALAMLPLTMQAQTQPQDTTLVRTVVVEQEYTPDIRDAAKVNVLPKVEAPTVSKKTVEYDATLMPSDNIPAGTMQAYTGKETQDKAKPGYARLGYGNYGNLDARANYLFAFSPKDRLNLTFAMDGMDGKLEVPETDKKWNSYFYRTRAAMDYVHAFNKVDLNVAGHFGLSNFNHHYYRNKQKYTSGDVHFGVNSTDNDMPYRFKAETNLMFYERQYSPFTNGTAKEGIVRTKADVAGHINDEQLVGLSLGMDNAIYNGELLKNHTDLGLNPYYLLQNDDWKVRLGAHVDLAFGFGKKFCAAPDVQAEYTFSDSYTLYAQAKGGKLTNDFRRLEMLNPYGLITGQPDATYEQLNAAIGFKASPAAGLWLHLYGGYQDLKNDLVLAPYANMSGVYPGSASAHTSNIYAGAEVSYDYKDLVSFSASGLYRNWDTDKERETIMLPFKPALEANFRMNVRPVSAVLVGIGYRHIARQETEGHKEAPVSNLYLSGSYEIFTGISIYARANNLLNKKYQYYQGCTSEGINFLGGVSFLF
ncbi:TonB-dependent receptor [uncultured Bacteroides sp.]|uniref:TonB-dependent receptor n=1 Tax=uncultured Bacteroides sp. TaxID=162156 RepID=UPI002603845A|nr:TonB-dependent receptor [uncultured Bacteroides sp.]